MLSLKPESLQVKLLRNDFISLMIGTQSKSQFTDKVEHSNSVIQYDPIIIFHSQIVHAAILAVGLIRLLHAIQTLLFTVLKGPRSLKPCLMKLQRG